MLIAEMFPVEFKGILKTPDLASCISSSSPPRWLLIVFWLQLSLSLEKEVLVFQAAISSTHWFVSRFIFYLNLHIKWLSSGLIGQWLLFIHTEKSRAYLGKTVEARPDPIIHRVLRFSFKNTVLGKPSSIKVILTGLKPFFEDTMQ